MANEIIFGNDEWVYEVLKSTSGGGGGIFIVNIDSTGDFLPKLDKKYNEILTAFQQNNLVMLLDATRNSIEYLLWIKPDGYQIASVCMKSSNEIGIHYYYSETVDGDLVQA